ncbi:MAG: hypothetical protein HYU41_00715 [Candidatus Rokubacteria bacterium]|nr:hypothetical protein [Candidatus Rokubacteria bacterium]
MRETTSGHARAPELTPGGAAPLRYEPGLVEDVVTRALLRRPAAHEPDALAAYHRRREVLYELPGAQRESAFVRLHRAVFHDLGFEATVTAVVARHAAALAAVPTLTMERATSPGDEAADLGHPGPAGRPGVVRMVARRFFDETLVPFLDHELTHLADLVDPAFAHDPDALDRVAPHRRRIVQQRYRRAWAVNVDGRLARAGRRPLAERGEHDAALGTAFASLTPVAATDMRERLWAGPRPTHGELLALATTVPARAPRAEGAPCPLCSFPTYRWAPAPAPAMAEAIRRDIATWQPDEGLCDRCYERFESTPVPAR